MVKKTKKEDIPFSESINEDGGNALQPLGSSTLFKLSSSLLLLTVFFTDGVGLLFVTEIRKLALFVIVFVCVTVCVKVLVAQMQVEGFDVTVTVTVLGTFCWHGSTTVMVVGIHDFVGFMTGSVGKVAEKGIKSPLKLTCDVINQSTFLAGCKLMSSLHNPLSMSRFLEICLVFPRLICRSQLRGRFAHVKRAPF